MLWFRVNTEFYTRRYSFDQRPGYLECVFTDLILRVYWPIADEKDLTSILIIRSDNVQH